MLQPGGGIAGWPLKKAPIASTLRISSNVDSAVSPSSDAGTRHQGIDTASGFADDIERGIRESKVARATGNGRAMDADPRRRLVGLSRQRATKTTVAPCAANSCADARLIPPLPPDKALHTLFACGRSHTAAVGGGWRETRTTRRGAPAAAGRTATPVRQPGPVDAQALRLQEGAKAGLERGRRPGARHRRGARRERLPAYIVDVPNGVTCHVSWFSLSIAIGEPSLFRNRCRIQSEPIRFTPPAGEGKSAREALASAHLRNATRCYTAVASPRRSFRCVFGSAHKPQCRPEHGNHASLPTD